MNNAGFPRIALVLAAAAVLTVGWLAGSRGASAEQRRFQRKECMDCHTTFADRMRELKNVHPGIRDGKCEDCHLRHGIVPKLLLKKESAELCLGCHAPDAIGLDKPHVHTPLQGRKCPACHDPHGSPGSHLLKAEGAEACYTCHDRQSYEKAVVHRVIQQDGCTPCHRSHSADEPDLLVRAATPLCLSCHPATDGAFKKAHGGYAVDKASCSLCHDPVMRRTHLKLLLVAALSAGCGDDTPTSPTTTGVTTVTEQSTGTVPVRETRFYSYEVTSSGTTAITLTSLNVPGSREVATARVQLSVGIPAGEGCAVSQSVTTSPGLTAQLTPSQSAGRYCTSITDSGELTTALDFTIRIVHP